MLAAETVNTSGEVPSDGPAGRGKLNAYVLPLCNAPGWAQAPLSPCTCRHALDASTPDWPAMLAEMASGPPAVSKKARPFASVKPAGVSTVTSVIRGASVATQTNCERSQEAPDAQSPSLEQAPRSDVRQAESVAQSTR